MRLYVSLLAVGGLSLPYTSAQPQGPAPFSELAIRVSAMHAHPDRRLADLYHAGLGAGIELETPFERGSFVLSAARFAFTARELPSRTDFDATLVALGWGLRLPTPPAIRAAVGLRAGDFLMAFSDTIVDQGVRDESELFLGAFATASLSLGHNVALNASASYGHIRLHVPVHLATLAAGIEYRIDTPAWLRTFLGR